MSNIFGSDSTNDTTILGLPVSTVTARLDALMMVLKSCKGINCTDPWSVLHPQGNVHDLTEALNSTYDQFYAQEQPKVSFSQCDLGYIMSAEGAQIAVSYSG